MGPRLPRRWPIRRLGASSPPKAALARRGRCLTRRHSVARRGSGLEPRGGEASQTFTILTATPKEPCSMIHKGCPILAREEWPRWLGEGESDRQATSLSIAASISALPVRNSHTSSVMPVVWGMSVIMM